MGVFSRKRKVSREDLEREVRDIQEINRRIDESDELQAAFRSVLGPAPAPPPSPTRDELHERIAGGGLSYIFPPADLQSVAPDAFKLFMQGVAAALDPDARVSLERFTQALEITRRVEHKRGEARLLYNVGVAHYKVGDLDRAIAVLLEGKALAVDIADDLAREARKLQRFEEEVHLDQPRVEVFGTPDIEQKLLAMFLEALATVYEASSRDAEAAQCRSEIERLYAKGR